MCYLEATPKVVGAEHKRSFHNTHLKMVSLEVRCQISGVRGTDFMFVKQVGLRAEKRCARTAKLDQTNMCYLEATLQVVGAAHKRSSHNTNLKMVSLEVRC
jgi:hypothetical protein